MVAGKEASPGDVKSTERLMEYWAHGEGAAKINWGVAGDFDRCVTNLSTSALPGLGRGKLPASSRNRPG